MEVKKAQTGNEITLTLAGRLDTMTSVTLQEALIPELEAAKSVVLDFEGLIYVSSAGLRVLLMGEKAAKATGAAQTLINVSEDIMEVFEMTGFSNILNIK